jgi:alpha-maltose-1-phosphate synthase
MRILYLTLEDLSLHKGSVVHIKEVIGSLRERGHRVGLMARASAQVEVADQFYNLGGKSPFLKDCSQSGKGSYAVSAVLLFLYLLKVLAGYDVIYARDYHTVIIALLPRILWKKKLVFEINGLANEELGLKERSCLNRILINFVRRAERLATKFSDRIICVTPPIAAYLIDFFRCDPNKIKVVQNGVSTKKFYPIHDAGILTEWKKKLGISEEEIIIAFIGNLAPWQGVDYLIQVAPSLIEEFKNIRVLIVGDGVLRDQLEEEVNNLGVSDHFLFTGMVHHDEIPLYINIADICVLPKRQLRSGYSPIKLYEYMACGKPIISSRVEGLEFIEPEGIGILTEPGNLNGIRQALLKLIQAPEERRVMGERGLRLAREKFDWKNKITEIEAVLLELA